jgi:hypothetical protein
LPEEPKDSLSRRPVSRSKAAAISSKLSVRLAAAKTVTLSVSSPGGASGLPGAGGVPQPASALEFDDEIPF